MSSIFEMKIDNFAGNSICFHSLEVYNNKKFIEKKIDELNNFNKLDLLDIKPNKGNIKIDQIRDIHDFLKYKPNYSKIKIVLINEIDKLNDQAENSLLKVLEEPPSFAVIITHTNSWNDLLSTTKSRLTRFDIPFPKEEIHLFSKIKDKNIKMFNLYSSLGLEYVDFFNNMNEQDLDDFINNLKEINYEKALKNIKKFKSDTKNKAIFIYSYYYIIKKIITENNNEFLLKTINNLKDIKKNLENPLEYLQMISLLSNIFIHDSLISKLTNKWKYMYNYDFIEFFGIEEYVFKTKIILDTYKYNNKIINSSLSNHNFPLEIINHFVRLNEAYSKK
ncbi:MAG: hypothetical protein ACQESN_03950 [Thermotogota bacterium]